MKNRITCNINVDRNFSRHCKNCKKCLDTLWSELKPLYLQLHAYVRRQLRLKYGEDVVTKDGPIPAHLLGNMWAQTWDNIAEFSTPYPGKQLPDVSDAMVEQGNYYRYHKKLLVNQWSTRYTIYTPSQFAHLIKITFLFQVITLFERHFFQVAYLRIERTRIEFFRKIEKYYHL